MHRIKIFTIGKPKENRLGPLQQEYIQRLQGTAAIEFIWAKDNRQLLDFVNKESSVVCLDSLGTMMNSEQLASFLHQKLQEGGCRLSFVIGGAEGLPQELKQGKTLVSLSFLTFTQQFSCLLLLEQIYRAFEIAKGSKYHK